jgi:hypothetical protein
MTVVIHDFEVVSEKPPAGEAAGAPASAQAKPADPPTPADIERVVGRLAHRRQRVSAH